MPLPHSAVRTFSILRTVIVSKLQTRSFKTVASTATGDAAVSKTATAIESATASKPAESEPALTRLKLYWKALYRDYSEVFTESLISVKSNPLKSSVCGIIGGCLCYCVKTNPDETAYRNYFLLCVNKMNLVGASIRNSKTEEYLTFIEASSNVAVLRRLSLGVFSLMWLDNYSYDSCVYKAMCPHLAVDYLAFYERILDVGFLGRWWILEKTMVDYDINLNEWPDTN